MGHSVYTEPNSGAQSYVYEAVCGVAGGGETIKLLLFVPIAAAGGTHDSLENSFGPNGREGVRGYIQQYIYRFAPGLSLTQITLYAANSSIVPVNYTPASYTVSTF